MKKTIIEIALAAGIVLCGVGTVSAQTATGRAFGTTLDLVGTNLVDQSDTKTKNAPNMTNTPSPDSFDGKASGATINVPGVAEVITGPSETRGCANASGCPELFATPSATDPLDPNLSNETFVHSAAGDATAAVLPGAAPGNKDVIDAVSSGSSITVRCDNDAVGTTVPQASGTSHVDALVIAGNAVPIPGTVAPNTTILAPQLPILVLNEQDCRTTSTSATCTVNALHAQLVTKSELLDLKLSGSTGTITFDPSKCVCNGPLLSNSRKLSEVHHPNGGTNPPAVPGDTIRYTIDIFDTGCVAATGVVVIDRIPLGTTFVPGSVVVAGTSMPNIGTQSCPNLGFPGCSPEAADTTRKCLTVPVGDVPIDADNPTQVLFSVTVDSTGNAGCDQNGQGEGVCNTALIQNGQNNVSVPASNSIPCPNGTPTPNGTQTPGGNGTPTPTATGTPSGTPSGTPEAGGTPTPGESGTGISGGDILQTTGSGGCSLGSEADASQMLPVFAIGLLLAVRHWRKHASRA